MVLLLTILLSGSVPTTAPTIVALMEANGDYFYRTAAHPDGLFGPEDIITYTIALLSLLATTHQQWISPPLSSSMVGRSICPSR